MKDTKETAIIFVVTAPDAANDTALFTPIAQAFQNDRFPPGIGSVKGFMRHVVKTSIGEGALVFQAAVPYNALQPTIMNLTEVNKSALAMALVGTMFAADELVTVGTFTVIQDKETKRVAAYSVVSQADSAKDVLKTGQVRMPDMFAAFVENVEDFDPQTTNLISWLTAELKPWTAGPKAVLEAAWGFLESGHHPQH